MWHSFRTVSYFTTWGLILGSSLGVLAGTLIFPFFGSLYAAFWGTGMGLTLGFVSGLLAALTNMAVFHPDMDLTRYRRRLAAGVGIFNVIGAVVLLAVSTRGWLWGYGFNEFSPYIPDLSPFFLLAAAAGAIGGGLSSAYSASHFADWYAGLMLKRKNEAIVRSQSRVSEGQGMRKFLDIAFSYSRLPMLVAVVLVAIGAIVQFPFPGIGNLVMGSIGAALYILVVTALLGLMNGAVITFLNRLLFQEYFPHQPPDKYRNSLMIIVFLFTLISSLVVSSFWFAPLWATGMALTVRSWAVWYSQHTGQFLSGKRDPKHEAAAQRLSDKAFYRHSGQFLSTDRSEQGEQALS